MCVGTVSVWVTEGSKKSKKFKKTKNAYFWLGSSKNMFWTCLEQKMHFLPQGGPLYRFFSKKSKFSKIHKNMFFCLPGPKKVFLGCFCPLSDINNREKLFKRVKNDYFYIDCVSREARPVRAQRGESLFLCFWTMLEQGLDAKRLQKHHFLLHIKLVPAS